MGWEKVIESSELIVFEKELKECKIKIEARRNHDEWEVFQTKIKGEKASLLSEHILESKKDVHKLIEKLKTGKPPVRKKRLNISFKRIFKEEFMEKWVVNLGKQQNFLYVKFDDNIKVDLVLHEDYRIYESEVIERLEENLGLDELGDNVSYDIFYYKKKVEKKSQSDYTINYVDIQFDFDD